MSGIILSNTASNRNIKTYEDGGGIMFRHKFVKQIYKGSTLIYEDDTAPHLVKLNTTIAWDHELFPKVYSFKAIGTEKDPIPVSGTTSEPIRLRYCRDKIGEYDDGKKIRFNVFENDSAIKNGKLIVDGATVASGNTEATYTIPVNSSVTGKIHIVELQSQENMSDDSTPTIYEYQTSNQYALFGLDSDSTVTPNLASVVSHLEKGSGGAINYTDSGTLLIRPLIKGQLEVSGDCYYCTMDGYYARDAVSYLTGYGIVDFPDDSSDLSNKGNQLYADAGFTIINGDSISLEPGKLVVIKFINSGSFIFSSKFSLSRTYVGNPNSNSGVSAQIKVTVDDGVSWTASTSDSWINISVKSGIGSGTFTISASANGETSGRSGYVHVTSGGKTKSINVVQGGNQSAVEFEDDSLVVKHTSNSWTFGIDEDLGTLVLTEKFYSTKFIVSKAGRMTITTEAYMDQEEQSTYLYASVSENNYDDQRNMVAFGSDNRSVSISLSPGTYYFKIIVKSGTKIAEGNYLSGAITFV